MALDPITGLLIMLGGIIFICLLGVILYNIIKHKVEKDSRTSIPEGNDSTEVGRMLQEKYQQERDSGDFKQQPLL